MSPFPPEDLVGLTPQEIVDAGVDDWRLLAGQLRARFATRTFARGVALIDRIGAAADAADHHPDVDLRFGHVVVAMHSHDVGAITARDIRLARMISGFASELGAMPQPGLLAGLAPALDTASADEIDALRAPGRD